MKVKAMKVKALNFIIFNLSLKKHEPVTPSFVTIAIIEFIYVYTVDALG